MPVGLVARRAAVFTNTKYVTCNFALLSEMSGSKSVGTGLL
jgi:hypothetical protein